MLEFKKCLALSKSFGLLAKLLKLFGVSRQHSVGLVEEEKPPNDAIHGKWVAGL